MGLALKGSRIRQAVCALAAACLIAAASGQIPPQAGWKYRSGQNVVPTFEGWEKNADGSFRMIFGYFNRNSEETVDIPIGPENKIEPGAADQGQPTFFLTGRHRFFFSVNVPKDWTPEKRLVWTLTARGRTETANGFLLPEWEVNTSNIQGSLTAAMDPQNEAPTIKAGGDQAITLANAAQLSVSISDDGRPLRRLAGQAGAGRQGGRSESTGTNTAPAQRGPGPNVTALAGAATGPMPPPFIEWVQYRGPVGGRAIFSPALSSVTKDGSVVLNATLDKPPVPVEGTSSTTVKFSAPGRYVVRAFVHDGGVWTPADITVTVN